MKIYKIFTLLTALVLLFSLIGCSGASKADPISSAEDFLSAYIEGDSDAAQALVFNYTTFDVRLPDDSEYHKLLGELLIESLSYEMKGADIHRRDAVVTADVTFFDFRKLAAPLADATAEEAFDRKGEGQSFEDEQSVMALLCDVVRELTAVPEDYYTTEQMSLRLKYDDGKWLVIMDESAEDILTGYAGRSE